MKRILLILAVLAGQAYGGANDVFLNQRNSADSATLTRLITNPGGNGIMGFNGATNLPVYYTFGPSLSLLGNALQCYPEWVSITGKPPSYPPSAHTHIAADIISGTLDDARIPDLAISKTTGLQDALDAKFNTPTGAASEYIRGDGTLATFPASKRLEAYTGTTDSNGLFTVTYANEFAATPSVLMEQTTSANQFWVKVSSTPAGFSFRLVQRAALTVLGVELLAANVTSVSGESVRAQVVE